MSLHTRKQERDFTAEVTALKPEVEALAKVRASLDHHRLQALTNRL
jgi:hypothetical protein